VFQLSVENHILLTVVTGTAAIGAVSGALGCFAYLRRQSLIGDIVSHSSLLGITLAFYLGYLVTGSGSKSDFLILPGAITAGFLALLLTKLISQRTILKEDTAMGVMLAIFFGSGVMVLQTIKRASPAIEGRAGLQDYLFGMAAAMVWSDILTTLILGSLAIAGITLLWCQLKVYTFDPVFAHSLGIRTGALENFLLLILVVGIVIGIHAVGVVLMIALLVTPASAARLWVRHLGSMVILAAMFGATGSAAGAWISTQYDHFPTGPAIVLSVTAIFLFSLFFAPGGLVRKWRNQSAWKPVDPAPIQNEQSKSGSTTDSALKSLGES